MIISSPACSPFVITCSEVNDNHPEIQVIAQNHITFSCCSLCDVSPQDGGLLLTYHSPNRAAFSRSSSKFMTCSARFGGIDLLSNGPASVCHMLFVDCCRPHSEDEVSDSIRLADRSGREGLRVPEHGVFVVVRDKNQKL
ncbi:hypothetical protein BLNAU_24329 [Blattamonas nauphoetae]|uniref:Uncharacterized protein n=1 Tax=Blattamonas nauphoetae TaxID=2049346 RepID=A0ABQ9WMP8_9EUKA|nr:hypothetical protein BLNAU_24329 [Blattamonas nauphoetae]